MMIIRFDKRVIIELSTILKKKPFVKQIYSGDN